MPQVRIVPVLLAAMAALAPWPAPAADPAPGSDEALAQQDRISALERKVDVLTSELERTRADITVPEDPELSSVFGMGPGASKVYSLSRGLSIGGYAEGYYRAIVDDKRESGSSNSADFIRGVLYVGYKFSDRIVYNMEIEFEHASTGSTVTSGGGSASIEFASLDFLGTDWLNARAGLLLVPMGFVNEVHEPPFFYGVNRPDAEQRIIPSTWRENGVGLFGTIAEQIDYKLYVVNGLNAEGFDTSGFRGGRQKGNRVLAEHLAVVGRLDYTPIPELTVGTSLYWGYSGQNQTVDGNRIPDAETTIWDVRSDFRKGPFHARGLFVLSHLGNADELSLALTALDELDPGEAVAQTMIGGYAEVGLEVLNFLFPDSEMTLEPFVRWEYVDTQYDIPSGFTEDRAQQVTTWTAGIHFQPIRNVVIKLDYRNREAAGSELGDEFNAGIGLVF